ncbi:MAG: transposase family protein [Chloroflexi bacterium]|nr:transposase family protein [Chloroflexota bacterium]
MSNMNTATPEPNQEGNEEQQEQSSILNALLTTIHHFFGDFGALFQSVDDPRRPELIIYPLESLAFAGVLLYLCHLGARRQIAHMFRENGPSAAKFQALFGTDTCPHGDTLDAAFGRLDPDQVQAVITAMIRTLIRKKVLDRYRLLGHCFVIAIDGTGRLTFPERHCPHCMTVTYNGKTTYYHPVLEAKLVLPNGFAFSILTEFIENPGENPSKQDCELKAFYRLAKRLKAEFLRLPSA